MATIEVNGVSIRLTKEQLEQIDNQRSKKYQINDITSYGAACEILGEDSDKNASNKDKLGTIIRAANFIDNENKEWESNSLDKKSRKYFAWFEYTDSGWVFLSSSYVCYSSAGWVGLYFKNENTCAKIAQRFIEIYNKYIEEGI